MQKSSKRTGYTMVAVDNDFYQIIDEFKKALEQHLGRTVSYPFVTNLLKNVIPKDIKVTKVWINDKKRRTRTVQFMVEYLMEEI